MNDRQMSPGACVKPEPIIIGQRRSSSISIFPGQMAGRGRSTSAVFLRIGLLSRYLVIDLRVNMPGFM